MAAKRFKSYGPVYLISGDTDIDDGETLHYYRSALNTLRGWEKPLLNGEPNYEGFLTFGGNRRITRFEVRRVSWQSVTAGAAAGITYGAHGVWPWFTPGDGQLPFYQSYRPFSGGTACGFRRPGTWPFSRGYGPTTVSMNFNPHSSFLQTAAPTSELWRRTTGTVYSSTP
jgi:hypothetical protein